MNLLVRWRRERFTWFDGKGLKGHVCNFLRPKIVLNRADLF